MTHSLLKRLSLLFSAIFLLFTAVPAHSHNMPMGGSRWCLQKNGLIGNIDLNQNLMSDIKEVKDGHYDLASISDKELQQMAGGILQAYINRKLCVTVNGKNYPIKVDRLARNDNSLFTIWLTVDRIDFDRPENTLKIDYRLLFDETNNTHLNMAFLYKSDATGEALQKVFDYSPPQGEHNFDSASPVWELSVKGTLPETATAPAIATATQTGGASPNKERKPAVTRTIVSVPPLSNNLPTPPVKGDDATSKATASKIPAAALSETTQSTKEPATNAVVLQQDSKGKEVSAGSEKRNIGALWSNIGNFIVLGIEHILTGYDHIAFLIGLIVIGLTFREVLKIITAFTVAHSITLLLAALQIVRLNSRFVESVIAFSICYVALENLFRKKVNYRWIVTFCFGLIHGFGFASALQELIVGKSNLVISVLSFNLGVETGQLMIFFVLLPVLHLLKKWMEFRIVTIGASSAVFAFGFTWLVERIFDLKLLPI